MDKGETPISVEDLLRLVDGLKAKGIHSFRWGDIEFAGGPVRAQAKKRTFVTPAPPEPKNAVDLALELNGRKTDSDDEGTE